MPAYKCNCGEYIDCSGIPNPNALLYIADVEYDEMPENVVSNELLDKFKRILVCPNCHRLVVFWDEYFGEAEFYKREG